MESCVFCKIVKKEIPAKIVFENEKVLAFLDINPLNKGHTLVIPKKHYENIFEVPIEELKEIIVAVKTVSEKLRRELDCDVNIFNASGKNAEQSVFHIHFHVIPRFEGDNLDLNEWWRNKVKTLSEEEMKEVYEKLKSK